MLKRRCWHTRAAAQPKPGYDARPHQMEIAHSRRARGVGKGVVAALTAGAVATVIATAAFGASSSRLTLHVSSAASISRSGSKLTIRGFVSCKTRRLFVLSVIALEPKGGATVHGTFPRPGRRAPICLPPRRSFKLVATQQGEKKPLRLKKSLVRACFVIRSSWRHTPLGLDARCVTLRASH